MGCSYIECEGYPITLCTGQKEHPRVSVPAAFPMFWFPANTKSFHLSSACVWGGMNKMFWHERVSKFLSGKWLEGFSRKAVGVLFWSCLKNLENRVRKWGWGSYGRYNLAVKQKRTNKTTQPERGIEVSGERGHQIDNLARNLDTVRDNLVPGHALGWIYCCFLC